MVGGGIAFNFSDMLGNHNLYAQISADTYGGGAGDIAKNTGVFLGYTNKSKRWNWGFAVEQSPYIAGGYATAAGKRQWRAGAPRSDDHPAPDQPRDQRHVGLSLQPDRRIEFGGGFTRTSFERANPDDVHFAAHRSRAG